MKRIVGIKFSNYGQIYFFFCEDPFVEKGDRVLAETGQGLGIATVMSIVDRLPEDLPPEEVRDIVRKVTEQDFASAEENDTLTYAAHKFCESRIRERQLDMKLVDVEVLFDRSKLVFYFTADNRVDFRELVKDLAGQFHTRIELRQIGVRDESKMLGGLGVCGQPFCCSRFLKNFQPVSIKMAKEQGLSLNPAKISGACGRLMCCLAYEQKSYEYLNSITPQPGSVVRTPDGEGTVLEANVVAGTLKVRSNVESLAPKIYKRSECTYLRGGRRAPVEPDPDHT